LWNSCYLFTLYSLFALIIFQFISKINIKEIFYFLSGILSKIPGNFGNSQIFIQDFNQLVISLHLFVDKIADKIDVRKFLRPFIHLFCFVYS